MILIVNQIPSCLVNFYFSSTFADHSHLHPRFHVVQPLLPLRSTAILKDHADGLPMNTVNMDSSYYTAYFDPEIQKRVIMTVAKDTETGEILGHCSWGKWNWDGSKVLVSECSA